MALLTLMGEVYFSPQSQKAFLHLFGIWLVLPYNGLYLILRVEGEILNKVKIFVWQVMHKRANTLDPVSSRVSNLVNCFIVCRSVAENFNHIH